jgi:hypothetical protein
MYSGDRGHDNAQYARAIRALMGNRERSTLIKMKFEEAVGIFYDEFFDFIYVDGYAHNGEEGGKTFYDWYPKLRGGGVLAGHDYSSQWPEVISAVDAFVSALKLPLFVINDQSGDWNFGSASWFIVKPCSK